MKREFRPPEVKEVTQKLGPMYGRIIRSDPSRKGGDRKEKGGMRREELFRGKVSKGRGKDPC